MEKPDRDDNNDAERHEYEAPAIVDSADFETLALACGLISDETPACSAAPSSS